MQRCTIKAARLLQLNEQTGATRKLHGQCGGGEPIQPTLPSQSYVHLQLDRIFVAAQKMQNEWPQPQTLRRYPNQDTLHAVQDVGTGAEAEPSSGREAGQGPSSGSRAGCDLTRAEGTPGSVETCPTLGTQIRRDDNGCRGNGGKYTTLLQRISRCCIPTSAAHAKSATDTEKPEAPPGSRQCWATTE